MDDELIQIRFLRQGGVVFLRKEDVMQYLLLLAATETTDVRDRLLAATIFLNKAK